MVNSFINIYTSQTKVCIVKTMVFPVVMYGCDRWSKTIKKKKLSTKELMLLNCGAGEDS